MLNERDPQAAVSSHGENQHPYHYQQVLPRQSNPSTPKQLDRIRRLLDELRQAKLDLQLARGETEMLKLRLAEAIETQKSLTEQLRYWQQQGLRWRKRLRQTEGLLKRVLKQYRELSRRSMQP